MVRGGEVVECMLFVASPRRVALPSWDLRVFTPIRSTTRSETPSSGCTRSPDEISTNGFSTTSWPETIFLAKTAAAAAARGGDGGGGF
ncbi:hypothetical protein F511_06793 [Dorcoceras hygrometricum]|uniref:Uncharacterized protein n=1 Tax=Dorcoceras hygrometricum TaxID=472368 RepID=A0A2Z7CHY8_9LAMI|nr:hypothetical protein F511_06793 [Dorcoceras hygrometricum]